MGAQSAQVAFLERRLERLAQRYEDELGVDVRALPHAGAAGGLAGGLAAAGAELVSGFDLVADWTDLDELIADVDLVITGEGRLDSTSFTGKVVGGVVDLAADAGVPVMVVAGRVDAGVAEGLPVVDLVERFGEAEAMESTLECIRIAVREGAAEAISSWSRSNPR